MSRRALLLGFVLVSVPFAACDCSGSVGHGHCTSSADCAAGEVCADSKCTTGDGAVGEGGALDGGGDAGPMCVSDTDCSGSGAVCVAGACCPSIADVCGTSSCCTGASVCLAGACVVPGDPCRTTADCTTGEYCEPSLGDSPDGGTAPDGGVCLGGVTRGRCIALPPACPAGMTTLPGGGTCIESDCEYHPPVGPLDAVAQWTWGPTADRFPNKTDVWSTPAVGRLYDTNCDGHVDELDPPNVVFMSNDVAGTCCQCNGATPINCLTSVLRVLDGASGHELWSLDHVMLPGGAASQGFSGTSVALGDVDGDHAMDVIAMTGEGYVVVLDGTGAVEMVSDLPAMGMDATITGWGGGLAIADMNGDGAPEIAFGANLFTTAGGTLVRSWVGAGGGGGNGSGRWLSTFADVDGVAGLDFVAGNTAYRADGTTLWSAAGLGDGFPAVADLDKDGTPEVVVITGGSAYILDGATGTTEIGPFTIGGTGGGGPPTVADFDGAADHLPEIGVAQADYYSVLKPDFGAHTISLLWHQMNHDLSSSETGSTVFDFEGDGISEVVYNDECYLWVFDGPTGNVRFAGLTSSFTGTEASLVADVDGDGHAEMVMISNGVDPTRWTCETGWPTTPSADGVRPAWHRPSYATAANPGWRGITVWKDRADSWVGTRPLWNEHTYHVSNVCDDHDDACGTPRSAHGTIPMHEISNWTLPWLDNFRQNVQQSGLFNAPDATVTLEVDCLTPPVLHGFVRNIGSAILPPGVVVGFFAERTPELMLGTGTTTSSLFPGQVEDVSFSAPVGATTTDTYVARILVDPTMPTFRECRDDNNESAPVVPRCLM